MDTSTTALLRRLNAKADRRARWTEGPSTAFAGGEVRRFELGNGLRLLTMVDRRAPVVAFHTWFRVGSRHEVPGKTGLAHLFEHLMFNETKRLPAGRFDTLLERAGAETNAATWTDWTYYYENVPRDQLALVVRLEAQRMRELVLRAGPVASEKEVVANERRYRVDDDVEGLMSEVLWATAFTEHPYHHPTIGWMDDILGFTPADCRAFYKTWYAPNNATVVVVGDFELPRLLRMVQRGYGGYSAAKLPEESLPVEPTQTAERMVKLERPTPTDKLALGYKCPGLAHPDHAALTVLSEALTGGRSSRFHRDLVTERELASEVAGFVSGFRDPGLWELGATARAGVSASTLLDALDRGLDDLASHPVSADERERAVSRSELSFLRALETVGGRAETIGFHDTVLGDPAGGFTRQEAIRAVTVEQLRDVTRRYLLRARRTIVEVRSNLGAEAAA
ncbi:MAG: pitrilysin family protein [Polyangiales bacterium]